MQHGIFDRYFTRSNVSIAKIASGNAQIDYENQHIQIVSEIRQAYGDYTPLLPKPPWQQIEPPIKEWLRRKKPMRPERPLPGKAPPISSNSLRSDYLFLARQIPNTMIFP